MKPPQPYISIGKLKMKLLLRQIGPQQHGGHETPCYFLSRFNPDGDHGDYVESRCQVTIKRLYKCVAEHKVKKVNFSAVTKPIGDVATGEKSPGTLMAGGKFAVSERDYPAVLLFSVDGSTGEEGPPIWVVFDTEVAQEIYISD